MTVSLQISEKSWDSIISATTHLDQLLKLFEFSIKIHTEYLANGYDYHEYRYRFYTLEFQNEKSYTQFIFKYSDLVKPIVD